ncbi:hypothetical protein KKA39_01650 [Patescibacteria group bacterium]|nr:hypothetical protein [Patescibacteria group bacterium]MBU1727994.1 hypothetical protein [Patescibacteria group bacterium]
MDLSQSLNLNTATQNKLFDPTYLNLEYIFNQILEFFKNIFGAGFGDFLRVLFFIFAVLFIAIIIYCIIRIFEIRKKEEEYLHQQIAIYAQKHAEKGLLENGGEQRNKKWEMVNKYMDSPNSNDWKLAIIEADTMLDGLMDELGFKGENLGEKLKQTDREKYPTLNLAWEPHTVRNRIAHEGSDFDLPQYEAKRLISIYERIFREFNYI